MIRVLRHRLVETRLPMRWIIGLAIAAAVVLISTRLVPSLTPERTSQASSDWSRGTLLGEAVNSNPIALWVESADDRVVAVSSRWIGDEQVLHWMRLDRSGQILAEHDLAVKLDAPRQAQLLGAPGNNLHLFFTALQNVNNDRALFDVSLDEAGNLRQAPSTVSDAGQEVKNFAAVFRGDRFQVFWTGAQGDVPNVYARSVDVSGNPVGGTVLIAQRAENPDARVDQNGAVHLTWVDEPPGAKSVRSLYYARIPPVAELSTPVGSTRIGNGQGASSDNVFGPVLGLTRRNVYALWSIERLSGASGGEIEAFYITAPLGKAIFSDPVRFDAPDDSKIGYGPYSGSLGIHQLAPLEPGRLYYNGATLNFVTSNQQSEELPVALSMNVLRGFNPVRKIGLLVFSDGGPKGYAVVAQTDQGSTYPSLAVDGQGDLYTTWFDVSATGSRNQNFYFASTNQTAKARLDKLTLQDLVLSLINITWGMSTGLGVVPLALVWTIPGLILATVVQLVRVDGDMKFLPERIAMAAAVVLYLVIKMTLLPGTFTYVPFSSWVPIMPDLLATVLRLTMPVLILCFALAVSYFLIVKTGQRQLLWMYIFFALADIVPTMFLYGPSFFGQ